MASCSPSKLLEDAWKAFRKLLIETPLLLLLRITQLTPLLNYIYYVFFSKAPAIDDIIDMSNSNLLVSALLFTVVAAIPLSITQEEMNKADADYGLTGKYGCHWYAAESQCEICGPKNSVVSMKLCQASFRAILCTLASILLAFICLLSISSLPEVPAESSDIAENEKQETNESSDGRHQTSCCDHPSDRDIAENEKQETNDKRIDKRETNQKKLKLWWLYAGRWILCISSLSLIGGIGFAGTSLQHVVEVRWHNEYRFQRCQEAGWGDAVGLDERYADAEIYNPPPGWDYVKNNTVGPYNIFEEAASDSETPVGVVWQGMALTLSLVSLSALLSGYLLMIGDWDPKCCDWGRMAPCKDDVMYKTLMDAILDPNDDGGVVAKRFEKWLSDSGLGLAKSVAAAAAANDGIAGTQNQSVQRVPGQTPAAVTNPTYSANDGNDNTEWGGFGSNNNFDGMVDC